MTRHTCPGCPDRSHHRLHNWVRPSKQRSAIVRIPACLPGLLITDVRRRALPYVECHSTTFPFRRLVSQGVRSCRSNHAANESHQTMAVSRSPQRTATATDPSTSSRAEPKRADASATECCGRRTETRRFDRLKSLRPREAPESQANESGPRPLRADAKALIAGAQDLQRGSVVTRLFCQGWRVGEVLGLAWDELDFDKGTEHIQQGAAYTPSVGTVLGSTKTSGAEGIHYLAPVSIAHRTRRRDEQKAERRRIGTKWPDHRYEGRSLSMIFTNNAGQLVNRQTITKTISRAAANAGIDPEGLATHSDRRTVFTARATRRSEQPSCSTQRCRPTPPGRQPGRLMPGLHHPYGGVSSGCSRSVRAQRPSPPAHEAQPDLYRRIL